MRTKASKNASHVSEASKKEKHPLKWHRTFKIIKKMNTKVTIVHAVHTVNKKNRSKSSI